MPLMEDSGIENEDKLSLPIDKDNEQKMTFMEHLNHLEDLKVIFSNETTSEYQKSKLNYGCINDYENINLSPPQRPKSPPNTCRILQRKLELKVERAKRNYCQYKEEKINKYQTQSASLIPINRLPIPGDNEQKLLVDYHNESDDPDEVSFFPKEDEYKQRHCKKYAELTDTFSIQEMTIETDIETDNESENLELLTPRFKNSFIEYLSNCFCFQANCS